MSSTISSRSSGRSSISAGSSQSDVTDLERVANWSSVGGLPQRNCTSVSVPPKRSLLFAPMPCEKSAAAIKESALDAIASGTTTVVEYRYIQSREGMRNARKSAIYQGLLAPFTLVSLAYLPPSIGNYLRFRRTKRLCEEYLERVMTPQQLQDLKQRSYVPGDYHPQHL